ncbi:hypothetical protein FM106_25470 [Brachybacterium faecium]|nr:hypothetical protein FM106_25470 [Brachybacterium faecium]
MIRSSRPSVTSGAVRAYEGVRAMSVPEFRRHPCESRRNP